MMKTSTKSLRVAGALACLGLGLSLSACGSSGQQANASGGQNGYGQGGQGQQSGQGQRAGGFPGGSGKVAAVSGSTAQVQGQGGQVAVTWTSKTTFAQQVSASAGDLKVGDCVMAMPATSSSSGSSDSSDSSTVKAATVRITAAVDGSCTGGMGGPGGQGGQGPGGGHGPSGGQGGAQAGPEGGAEGGTPPQGAPEGAPEGGNGGGSGSGNAAGRPGMGMRGAFGKVTAVDGDSFTVASSRPGATSSSSTEKTTVKTTSETTWTTTKAATAKAVQVGRCVVTRGQAGSTGAVTASSIMISQPVDGQCSGGFGPGRPAGDGQDS